MFPLTLENHCPFSQSSACVIGASIICVDLIIQRIPGKRHFRIQDSNAFLASSLSLSFGVMLFSSLYSMLPSAQKYNIKGGVSASAAAWITIGCFLGGVVGIQFLSRILHHYIPSHIVDCDHTHDEVEVEVNNHHNELRYSDSHTPTGSPGEQTPLLVPSELDLKPDVGQRPQSIHQETAAKVDGSHQTMPPLRRPSLHPKLTTRVATFITGSKSSCDEGGPCYGYGDPCGRECLKLASRSPTRAFERFSNLTLPRQQTLLRTKTAPRLRPQPSHASKLDEESLRPSLGTHFHARPATGQSGASANGTSRGRQGTRGQSMSYRDQEDSSVAPSKGHERDDSTASKSGSSTANDPSHHHHVPTNAFLAIGLQTSIAIALHKLPEGFITYATNHANPKLGFSVFMALFIHNITEGFAMALPLYLAINSRLQAMFWSSVLGGVSQPLGAGVAALWFKIAGKSDKQPDDVVYGCMFSVTAGIMASVALQLFSESLTLTHNRHLCTAFAFIGMGMLGISYALTA